MATERIREGFDVFVHDGEKAVGAVRRVSLREFVIYVENSGEFTVPLSAVRAVHDEKVVLDCGKLDQRLRSATGHAHDAEDPNIP
jgi:hypothetical protein